LDFLLFFCASFLPTIDSSGFTSSLSLQGWAEKIKFEDDYLHAKDMGCSSITCTQEPARVNTKLN